MHSTEADAVEAFKDWLAIYRRPQTVRNRVHYASRLRAWAIAHDRHLWSLTTRDLTQWLTMNRPRFSAATLWVRALG